MAERGDGGSYSLPQVAWGQSETAAAYERGRPGYAPGALAALAQAFRLGPGTSVLDLGAGTGKLTRQLLATGARVTAIEPIHEMRKQFTRVLPEVAILDGSAEAIPRPTQSVDLVVVGQAWHWFDGPEALDEVGRVLVPGGGLALLWNDYDRSVTWARELAEIRDRHFDHHAPPQADRDWRADFAGRQEWSPLTQQVFDHVHRTTRQALVDRVLSTSVIAPLPVTEREAIGREVLAILDRHGETRGHEDVDVPYQTDVFWTRRLQGPSH